MAAKLHQNAIITGHIDLFCLICETHIQTEAAAYNHISKSSHCKNLEAASYVDKYKDDFVRKIKKYYFCECCNTLFTTLSKVGLHVDSEKHIENKHQQLLKRVGGNIVAFGDVAISEKAWNGMIDNTCFLCNEEFDNEKTHKVESTHILNLIQSKTEFGPDKTIYRKVDENIIQCLTCNQIMCSGHLSTHLSDSKHKKNLENCRNVYIPSVVNVNNVKTEEPEKNVPKSAEIVNGTVKKEVKPKVTNEPKKETPKVNEPLFKFGFLNKPANTETKKAVPPAPVVIKKTKPDERQHIPVKTIEMDNVICDVLSAVSYICTDEYGQKMCLICNWSMDDDRIDNHVSGIHHQTMLKLHKEHLRQNIDCKENHLTMCAPAIDPTNKDTKKAVKQEQSVKSATHKETNKDTKKKPAKQDGCNRKQRKNSGDSVPDNNRHQTMKSMDKFLDHIDRALDHQIRAVTTAVLKEDKNIQTPQQTKSAKKHGQSDKRNTIDTEDAEKFAEENDFVYNANSKKALCRTCNMKIPVANMRKHIVSGSHKKAAKKEHALRHDLVKEPLMDFIKTMSAVESGCMKDIFLNKKFVINILSFMMITKHDGMRCQLCETELSMELVDMHVVSKSHKRGLLDMMVVTSIDGEFIREVRPDVFHCGFCNLLIEELDPLLSHLQRVGHRENRNSANWRMNQYTNRVPRNPALASTTTIIDMLTEGQLNVPGN